MRVGILVVRAVFVLLSFFFMTSYMMRHPAESVLIKTIIGLSLGATLTLAIVGIELFFKRFSLRMFNIATVGLFSGYLMGNVAVTVLDTLIRSAALQGIPLEIINLSIYLTTLYLGTLLAFRFADEFHITIPFIHFSQSTQKKRDILLDPAVLADIRIVDFCSHGLLNNQVILARFIVNDLQAQLDSHDEGTKAKARKSLDVIKKLESLPHLKLRYHEADFEGTLASQKLFRLARLLDANILTADHHRTPSESDVLCINFYALSNAMKPLTPPGETITLKIQRYGKEPKQGVGYLEDGTMVVVNNGGDWIGEVIDTQVISVKQTSAGRIIFTNALAGEHAQYEEEPAYDHHA